MVRKVLAWEEERFIRVFPIVVPGRNKVAAVGTGSEDVSAPSVVSYHGRTVD